MKNLKRVLSLVLATVMVIGMMVVGASAADYKDADKISYKEAVDVMTAVGMIEGYDGSFGPDITLTRGQAAKLIAYLAIGGDTIEKMAVTESNFTDVDANAWYAKYVAFCAAEGIINGYNGQFAPDATVTAYEFASMLLSVLGYKKDVEGLTGDNWQINTAKLAVQTGLFTGNTNALGNAAVTREEACLYAFNALKATRVVYTNGSNITIGDITITNNYVRNDETAVDADNVPGDDVDYNGANDHKVQLCEALYPTLEKKATGADAKDAFERPGYTWYFDNDAVTFVGKAPVKTYTKAVTGGQLYTDLGKPTQANGAAAVLTAYKDGASTSSVSVTSGATGSIGGNGVVTEIYKTGTGLYTAVMVNTYVGTINTYHAAELDKNGDVIEGKEESVNVAHTYGWATNATFKTSDFTKADATNNTVVLFTATWDAVANKATIRSVEAAKAVENVGVTAFKTGSGAYVTADGIKYTYSANEISGNSYTMNGKATYTLYLDNYGYVIDDASYTAAASTDYYYISAVSIPQTVGNFGTPVNFFEYKLVGMDGNVSIVKAVDNDTTPNNLAGQVVTYTADKNNDGFVVMSAVAVTMEAVAGGKIDKTNPAISANIVTDADTLFVLRTNDSPETWKTYTGISNIPAIQSITYYPRAVIGADGYADVVFLALDGGNATDNVTSDLAFILGNSSSDKRYDAVNDVEYYAYPAIVDGELTEIFADTATLTTDGVSATVGVTNGLVEIKEYNSNGYITKVGIISETNEFAKVNAANNAGTNTFSAPTLKVGSVGTYLTTEDTVVYYYNTAEKTLTVGTPADLVGTASASDTVSVITVSGTDKTVATIFYYGVIG